MRQQIALNKQTKKLVLSFVLLLVLGLTVATHEKLLEKDRVGYILADGRYSSTHVSKNASRNIASVKPTVSVEDINWEHSVLQKIVHSERGPSSIGIKATQADELRFGMLAGKYRISNKIIEYIDSVDVSDKPVMLPDAKQFLTNYKSVFQIPYENVFKDSATATSEVYKLFDKNGQAVGKAAFQFDDSGRFISLKVEDIK